VIAPGAVIRTVALLCGQDFGGGPPLSSHPGDEDEVQDAVKRTLRPDEQRRPAPRKDALGGEEIIAAVVHGVTPTAWHLRLGKSDAMIGHFCRTEGNSSRDPRETGAHASARMVRTTPLRPVA
jgi:hypothetical protein